MDKVAVVLSEVDVAANITAAHVYVLQNSITASLE